MQKYVYQNDEKKSGSFKLFGNSQKEGGASQDSVNSIALEEYMRNFTGKIEELEFSINKVSSKLDKAITELDNRLLKLENNSENKSSEPENATIDLDAEKSDKQPIDLGSAKNPHSKKNDESQEVTSFASPSDNLYEKSFAYMRDNKYEEAQKSLEQFIKTNPSHKLLGNAYYWLGETFYVRNDYKNAAVNFLKGYKDFPKNSKISDNLYKLGMSLNKLGKKEQACATFLKITEEYPKTDKNLMKKIRQEIKKNNCS